MLTIPPVGFDAVDARPDRRPTLTPAALRALGVYQRLLLVLVLVQLLLIAGLVTVFNFGSTRGEVDLFILCFAALWVVGFAVGLVAFQIGHILYGWYGGLALGGLALLSMSALTGFGLVAILVADVLMNRAFRRHGIRVGLLGTSRADLDGLGEPGDPSPAGGGGRRAWPAQAWKGDGGANDPSVPSPPPLR